MAYLQSYNSNYSYKEFQLDQGYERRYKDVSANYKAVKVAVGLSYGFIKLKSGREVGLRSAAYALHRMPACLCWQLAHGKVLVADG